MSGRFQIPNKAYIRQDDERYSKAFQAIEDAVNRTADQANVDPMATAVAPPAPISGLSVVAKDGIHDIQITDKSPAYRGIQYSAFYSRTADMLNAHRIDLGESQNHRANLGDGVYHWAAASKYTSSEHSAMVYHAPVGSGVHVGPPMQPAQVFNGIYRSSTTPPVRK